MNEKIIFSKIVGVSFEGRQKIIPGLEQGQVLELEREPDNKFDKNAVKVMNGDQQIGYIKKYLAVDLADAMDKGLIYKCFITCVTGDVDKNFGVNIIIEKVIT